MIDENGGIFFDLVLNTDSFGNFGLVIINGILFSINGVSAIISDGSQYGQILMESFLVMKKLTTFSTATP